MKFLRRSVPLLCFVTFTWAASAQSSGYVFAPLAGRGLLRSVDGPAREAAFSGPASVATDRNGNGYVADFSNNTIRKISANGVVSTLAGSPGIAGSADGNGSAARFNAP